MEDMPFYLRTLFRVLSSWVHRSTRWSKNRYAEDRLVAAAN